MSSELDRSSMAFVAEVTVPARRTLHLSLTGLEGPVHNPNQGWKLIVEDPVASGEARLLGDHWEQTLLEILRYPPRYSKDPLDWRRATTGAVVDVMALQPTLDASPCQALAQKIAVSPDGSERVCMGPYDDGSYRFVLEHRHQEGGLTAWVMANYSRTPHADLAGAEEEAQRLVGWLHAPRP